MNPTISALQGKQYESRCPEVKDNRKPFYEDPFWTKVNGVPAGLRPTEHDVYAQNNRGWRLTLNDNLQDQDADLLTKFSFDMYQL